MKLTKYGYLYSALLIALAISGCSSPPDEVKGVCKSCKPYYVRGEWHTPQKHYDYDEFGLASWYGPGFHGKPKPHGEPYNQYEMTAAHKTLPIPTIAKVTNLETGATTKVLIDDRGPFVYQGRIIDLSVAAAQKIGVYKKGTAKVRVTALREESDRFARHLTQYKRAKCPKGRRWIEIFRQDIASDSNDLTSHHHQPLQKAVYNPPSADYTSKPLKQKEPQLIQVRHIQEEPVQAKPLKQQKPQVLQIKQTKPDDALDYISKDWRDSKPEKIKAHKPLVTKHLHVPEKKSKIVKTSSKLLKKHLKKHKSH